jgi:uncharacterized protein (TIGR00369 family)
MASFRVEDPDFEARVRASFARLALMDTIGARLRRIAPGEVDIELAFRLDLTQHHGFLSAAVVTAIVDTACGYAAMTLLPSNATVLTVEFKANFLSPARGERMVARSRVVKPGRTLSVCAGDVFAEDGGREKLVATMLATIMMVSDDRREVAAGETGRAGHRHHAAGQHGPRPSSRMAPRWCPCGGRSIRQRLRDVVGIRR